MAKASADAGRRTESDRLKKEGAFSALKRKPEVGVFLVMVVVILAIGFASNGNAFNPLGLKNNFTVIAQFGIIATGACLLMIAGDFDLSIGSMIGFSGMSMAMMLKWGLPFGLGEATPLSAFLLTLVMTLFLGWLIGTIVVRSKLSSFIVTLAFLFFLRGVTEVSFRVINQSTQISGLPDYKDESWFAYLFGGETFGWFYDAWFWLGGNLNRAGDQWVTGFDARVLWWIVIAGLAYVVLSRTQAGNWIYATGDNRESGTGERRAGRPGEDLAVHVHRLLRHDLRRLPGVRDQHGGRLQGQSEGARSHRDRGRGRHADDRRLRLGDRCGLRRRSPSAWWPTPCSSSRRSTAAYYRVFVGVVLLIAVFLNESVRKRITGGL